MYFFHKESDYYVEIKKGKKLPTGEGFMEVSKEAYEKMTKKKESENTEDISVDESKPVQEESKEETKADSATEPTQEPNEDKPNITKEMVREVCAKAIKAGKSAEVKKIVADHGAKSIPTLKEEEYASVYEEVGGLL